MKLLLATFALAALSALCGRASAQSYTGWKSNGQNWKLVFQDEFDWPSLNTSNWSRVPYVSWEVPDWRKYQSTDPSLLEITSNGTLKLWARYGNYSNQQNRTVTRQHACASIWTADTFSFQYGYMEVQARFESATGVWPAIWLISNKGPWPATGEIDLIEHLNWNDFYYSTLHYTNSSGAYTAPSVTTALPDRGGSWHTYGVEWLAGSIHMYLDGKRVATFNRNSTNWPFDDLDNEFKIILSQQIGGAWVMSPETGGNGNIGPIVAESGRVLEINYVRVYSDAKYTHSVPKITVEQPETTALASGGSRDFGAVGVGEGTELAFTLRNPGSTHLHLTGSPRVAVSGPHAAEFSVTAPPASPVAPGGSTSFTVRFAPTAAGPRSAVLTIASDDPDLGTFTLQLGGTGVSWPIAAFLLAKDETTKGQWDAVRAWGASNGYTDLPVGATTGGTASHSRPVDSVSWYDVVKWCNAASQKDGHTPVYYTDAAFTTVYKTGSVIPFVNPAANGYRLPTEAEWEWAARSGNNNGSNGFTSSTYPWASTTINNTYANYDNNIGSSTTVGSYTPGNTSLGLRDMAGNVWEWTLDANGSERVMRGGSWNSPATYLPVSYRDVSTPSAISSGIGFRVGRNLSPSHSHSP